ncbi:MAG: baseplate J/gp47 family protein [Patescibacteria group bacterium]|nr:baseplate J/gp47 family protein [Patescibacteria group bacterium]
MKLPEALTSFLPQKKETPKTYLALELSDTGVKVLAWEISGEKISILSQTVSEFRGTQTEEKIRVCDQAVSRVEEQLPAGQNLKEVVFGLSEKTVTADNRIVSAVSSFLHKLCNELSLTPVGFVVINEAIANYLKKEEGAPLTAILVNLNGNNLSCALIRAGKAEQVLFKNEVTEIGEALSLIFKQFQTESLPSRILLYDFSSNLEPVRQELISYPWLSRANFLHFPKLEILSDNQDLKAIAYAGSSELLSHDFKVEEQTTENNEQKAAEEEKGNEKEEPTLPQEEKPVLTDSAEEFGFVKDQDILKVRNSEQSFEAEAFKQDISDNKQAAPSEPELSAKPQFNREETGPKKFSFLKIDTRKFFQFLMPQNISLPKVSLPANFNNKAPLVIFPLVILLVLAVLFYGYWFFPKAKVTILVSPKILNKQTEVLVATASGQIEAGGFNTIPGQVVSVDEETSGNASATGSKLIGDKAKGQVTIYNKTESAKTFSKGTVIETSSGLQFSLDSDAQVASTSAFATSFSSVGVNVTAMQIGTDSNLAFGTNFTFANFPASSFIAKNDNAFSGGTSKQVQAVSQDDQDKLLASLNSQLLDKAKKDLANQNDRSQSLIADTLEKTVVKKTFSVPVGTQVQQFSLSLKLNFKALAYNQSQMKGVLEKIIGPDIPGGYIFAAQNSNIATSVKSVKKDGTADLNVSLTANLLPDIDIAKVQKQLAGQSLQAGQKYLMGLPGVAGVKPVFLPNLPGFLQTYPHQAKNISVSIEKQ